MDDLVVAPRLNGGNHNTSSLRVVAVYVDSPPSKLYCEQEDGRQRDSRHERDIVLATQDQFDALEGIEGPSEVSCIDMQGKILIGLGLDRSC
jgi:hypothetical protein